MHFLFNSHITIHFFYIPIILAALWWNYRGLIVPIILTAFLLITHFYSTKESISVDCIIDMVLFFGLSVLIAFQSNNLKKSIANYFTQGNILRKEISERAIIEGITKETNYIWQSTFDSLSELIFNVNINGEVLKCNKSANRYLKKTEHEIIGLPLWELLFSQVFIKEECLIEEAKIVKKRVTAEKLLENKWLKIGVDPIIENNEIINLVVIISDITERKNVFNALKESELKFRTISDNIYDWEYWKDVNGIYKFVSNSCEKICGYKAEDFYNNPTLLHEITHPDYKEQIKKHLSIEQAKDYDDYIFEYKIISKEGKIKWIEHNCSPVYDDNNNYIGRRGNNRDITIQKEYVITLDENKKKYEDLVELANAAIVRDDKDGNITYCNSQFANLFGYTLEEILKLSHSDLVHPKDRERIKEIHKKRILESESARNFEFEGIKKNGETIFVNISVSDIIKNKNETFGTISYLFDISERKKNEKIQKVLFNISQASTKLIDLNKFIDVIKSELTEIVVIKNFFFAYYNEEKDEFHSPYMTDEKDNVTTWPAVKSLSAYVVRNKKSVFFNKELIQKLKAQGEIEIVGSPCKVWLGSPVLVDKKVIGISVVQDYHNENAYNQSDFEILDYLAEHVSRLIERKIYYDKIEKALKQAQESDQLKTAFITNLSHEVRTPLNGLLGFVKLILNPNVNEEKKIHYAQIIDVSAKQLTTILEDIMEISRLETGQISIYNKEVYLKQIIEESFSNQINAFNLKKINLKSDFDSINDDLIIYTDKTKIEKIIKYLLDNALKFTEKGEVIFRCKQKPKLIEFSIKDTGIGIDITKQEDIFKNFRQVEVDVTRKYGGNVRIQ
jgi:PAS domain S-box-containing protein